MVCCLKMLIHSHHSPAIRIIRNQHLDQSMAVVTFKSPEDVLRLVSRGSIQDGRTSYLVDSYSSDLEFQFSHSVRPVSSVGAKPLIAARQALNYVSNTAYTSATKATQQNDSNSTNNTMVYNNLVTSTAALIPLIDISDDTSDIAQTPLHPPTFYQKSLFVTERQSGLPEYAKSGIEPTQAPKHPIVSSSSDAANTSPVSVPTLPSMKTTEIELSANEILWDDKFNQLCNRLACKVTVKTNVIQITGRSFCVDDCERLLKQFIDAETTVEMSLLNGVGKVKYINKYHGHLLKSNDKLVKVVAQGAHIKVKGPQSVVACMKNTILPVESSIVLDDFRFTNLNVVQLLQCKNGSHRLELNRIEDESGTVIVWLTHNQDEILVPDVHSGIADAVSSNSQQTPPAVATPKKPFLDKLKSAFFGKGRTADGSGDNMLNSQQNGDYCGTAEIKFIIGDICTEKVDVVVNSTNSQINGGGALSQAILAAGGPTILVDFQSKYPSGIPKGGTAVTIGGSLACSSIVHVDIQSSDLQTVFTSLVQWLNAQPSSIRTISIPPIGTGGLNQDCAIVASAIRNVIVSNLTRKMCINFIFHSNDASKKTIFQQVFGVAHQGSFVPNNTSSANAGPSSLKNQQNGDYCGTAEIKFIIGDICTEKVDVVVNSTNSQINGGGALSQAILAAGGPTILVDFQSKYPSGIPKGGTAVTIGGSLACSSIVHVDIQSSDLQTVFTSLVQWLNAQPSSIRTISIPPIGTGGLNQDCAIVASAIRNVIVSNLTRKMCINFIFHSNDAAKKTIFQQVFGVAHQGSVVPNNTTGANVVPVANLSRTTTISNNSSISVVGLSSYKWSLSHCALCFLPSQFVHHVAGGKLTTLYSILTTLGQNQKDESVVSQHLMQCIDGLPFTDAWTRSFCTAICNIVRARSGRAGIINIVVPWFSGADQKYHLIEPVCKALVSSTGGINVNINLTIVVPDHSINVFTAKLQVAINASSFNVSKPGKSRRSLNDRIVFKSNYPKRKMITDVRVYGSVDGLIKATNMLKQLQHALIPKQSDTVEGLDMLSGDQLKEIEKLAITHEVEGSLTKSNNQMEACGIKAVKFMAEASKFVMSHTLKHAKRSGLIFEWQARTNDVCCLGWYKLDDELTYEMEQEYLKNNKSNNVTLSSQPSLLIDFSQMIAQMSKKSIQLRRISRDAKEKSIPCQWQSGSGVRNIIIDPKSVEFQCIVELIRNTGTVTVKQIERIENVPRYQQYHVQYENVANQLVSEGQPGVIVERWLFHGTADANVDKIIQNALFDRGLAGANATLLGFGSYFARDFSYSHRYTKGGSRMFLARVITGNYAGGNSSMKTAPYKTSGTQFHSVVDNEASPGMFVVFSDNQAYPQYLITFA